MEEKGERMSEKKKKIMSACDVQALKKCLEENKGNSSICKKHIDAFKSSCSLKKPVSSSSNTAGEGIK